MFSSQGYASAARRYAAIDTSSRVEGATPHQLVRILFEELLRAMDSATLALKGGDMAKATERQTRALTILHALESSLDFEKGGEIALSLATIYRESRRRMIRAIGDKDAAPMESARAFIADIASAWDQIA